MDTEESVVERLRVDGYVHDRTVNGRPIPDDPITAREAVEQVLIDDGRSEAGAEVGDEMP